MLHQLIVWLAETVGQWGYPGIILLMALESSFFPFPSEVVIPPAAYLAAGGQMNLGLVIVSGVLGSLIGSAFNYWLALKLGRPFLEKYGRFFLISARSLEKADRFFKAHGPISTFIGRLLPGIRQYISLPAGLTRMNIVAFSAATGFGAAIWVAVLAAAGYWFGHNEQLVLQQVNRISLGLVIACVLVGFVYLLRRKKRSGHAR